MTPDKQAELIENYQTVFRGPQGAMVLQDLMDRVGFFDSTASDPNTAMYNEGARSVIVNICRILEMDMKQYRKHLSDVNIDLTEESDDV